MPWTIVDRVRQRRRFVALVLRGRGSFAALCRQCGISRPTGYKWWRRFRRDGGCGLRDRSTRPLRAAGLAARWCGKVLALRRRFPSWGAPKLRAYLQRLVPRASLPAVCTLGRWMRQVGEVRRRVRRARPGPRVPALVEPRARRPNDCWTMDFKGSFRTADGRRVLALTVRDEASCYVLAVRQLHAPSEAAVRLVCVRLFRRYGMPRAMRVDNGAPFGGSGPLGLSRLSVWWWRLGVQVRFSRRACPQDNAAHEQMHRVLKRETAQPPAVHGSAQQRRFDRWRRRYNEVRPHQRLGQRCPCEYYRPSMRAYPARRREWRYPSSWAVLRPADNGRAWWGERQRMIGRAFAGERLGLRPLRAGAVAVYLGPLLIGTLHFSDQAGLRPARWSRSRRRHL
jgi:putative transposase